jgi:hypothetical protein
MKPSRVSLFALEGFLFSNNEIKMTKTAYFKMSEAEALFGLPAAPIPAIGEYETEQLAIQSNYQRLRAARLAREAAINSK